MKATNLLEVTRDNRKLQFFPETFQALVNGADVKLGDKHARALAYFLERPEETIEYPILCQLHNGDWKKLPTYEPLDEPDLEKAKNSIRVFKSKLKTKLGFDCLETIPRVGIRVHPDCRIRSLFRSPPNLPWENEDSSQGQKIWSWFFDKRSRFCERNQLTRSHLETRFYPSSLVPENLSKVVSWQLNRRSLTAPLISTNATLLNRGVSTWFDDDSARTLINATAGRTNSADHPQYRVFFYDPAKPLSPGELRVLHSVLNENRVSGVQVIVASIRNVPKWLPMDLVEFDCVPGETVFVSVPPFYFMAEFDRTHRPDIVQIYSEFAKPLVNKAKHTPSSGCFLWVGKTVEDLTAMLQDSKKNDKGKSFVA